MSQPHQNPLLKLPEVIELTRLSRATIYRAVGAGTFPQPVKIGEKAIAWRREEVEAWIAGLQPRPEKYAHKEVAA